MTVKPRWPAGLRTISTVMRSSRCAQSTSWPAKPPSAHRYRMRRVWPTWSAVQAGQGAPPALAVWDAGGADQDCQQQAERVSDDEPLPTAGLAGVVASAVPPDRVGAVHALGIDRPGGRVGVASPARSRPRSPSGSPLVTPVACQRAKEPYTEGYSEVPCRHLSTRVGPGQGTVNDLSSGVLNNPHRLPRREVHRQRPPGTAGAVDIQDRMSRRRCLGHPRLSTGVAAAARAVPTVRRSDQTGSGKTDHPATPTNLPGRITAPRRPTRTTSTKIQNTL